MQESRVSYDRLSINDHLEAAARRGPLPRIHDGKATEYTYSEKQRFTPEKEEDVFTQLLVEEGTTEITTKHRRGPHQEVFTRFMMDLQTKLRSIDPTLTAEHLAGFNYQSNEVRQKVAKLPREQIDALLSLRRQRITSLGQLADRLAPDMEGQLLAPEVLDAPPYYPSAHDWDHALAPHGCANACFRMIYGGIAGETPSQTTLSRQLIRKYGTPIVHDEVLTNLMKTPAFKNTYGKQIHTVEYIGADFKHIQKAASLIKRHRPESGVYCFVNLGSASDPTIIWHTGVLLAADTRRVVYHDPSNVTGGAYHTLDKKLFLTRWTQTYNRAKLVIST